MVQMSLLGIKLQKIYNKQKKMEIPSQNHLKEIPNLQIVIRNKKKNRFQLNSSLNSKKISF